MCLQYAFVPGEMLDPEIATRRIALMKAAGVKTVWMTLYMYGTWSAAKQEILQAKTLLEKEGFEVQAATVPVGHGTDSLLGDGGDPELPITWQNRINAQGQRVGLAACVNSPAMIKETREVVDKALELGFTKLFYDDDLRVVEWPANFRHGYDVDIREGRVCHQAHVSINAYYIAAIRTANKIASELELSAYRDESVLLDAFYAAFYDPERKVFKDGEYTEHVSLVGNVFAYGLDLCPNPQTKQNILAMLDEHSMSSLSMFCTFPMMWGLVRDGEERRILDALLHDGTWTRILREGGTTTFEGWGKDTKWNTSLFHLTMSYGALFMADVDLKMIL